jgi:DNA-binding Lrp family transcriptional regulator
MKLNFSENSLKKISFDLKDKKILSLLGINARIPLTQLAKEVQLSREAVQNRFNNYLKAGVIQGFRTVVDISKFGFDNYHVFLKMKNLSEERENEFISRLKSHPFIRAILKFSGKYDYELAIVAKNTREFEKDLDTIFQGYGNDILDYEILILSEGYASGPFPKNFVEKTHSQFLRSYQEYKLDDLDFKILNLISNDARMKLYEVASKLNVSSDTINYRIKKMLSSGHIIRFIPAINYDLLGYEVYAIPLSISLFNDENKSKLKQFFATDKNVLWATRAIGKFNLLFYICATDPRQVHETLQNLRKLFPEQIKEYETLMAFEEYKFTYLPKKLLNDKV